MEADIAENAERIDGKIVQSDTKNRSLTGRIRELLERVHGQFEEFKKSIKGAIDEVKKMKLFEKSKKEMLSQRHPKINLSPRR